MTKNKTQRRTWTPAQKAKILAYAKKHSVAEAAEENDVTESSIYTWKSKAKAAAPKASRPRVSNGVLGQRAAVQLFASGWSIQDTAKVLKVSPKHVEDLLRSTL